MKKTKIKRFDKSFPLPAYKTSGAAAADVYSREDTTIEPFSIGYIPLNIAIELPKGYCLLLLPRSSTHKLGIMSANSVGVLDEDFNGDNDELRFVAYNFTNNAVTIEKGTRLAQILPFPTEQLQFEEVDSLENDDRGGIGSTGF